MKTLITSINIIVLLIYIELECYALRRDDRAVAGFVSFGLIFQIMTIAYIMGKP